MFLKSEAVVPTVIKAPWRARTVNAGTAPGMLSELTKEEGDGVVIVLHEILPCGRGRELGQPAMPPSRCLTQTRSVVCKAGPRRCSSEHGQALGKRPVILDSARGMFSIECLLDWGQET